MRCNNAVRFGHSKEGKNCISDDAGAFVCPFTLARDEEEGMPDLFEIGYLPGFFERNTIETGQTSGNEGEGKLRGTISSN